MKIIISIILILFVFPMMVPAHAACFTTAIGNKTNSSACTIAADTYECADGASNNEASSTNNAVLTVSTAAITLNSGSTGTTRLNVGSLSITSSGSIAIGSTKVSIGIGSACWVGDADADGFITNTTLSTATAAGKRRLGLMRHPSTADCNDSSYNTTNVCWSYSYGQAWYYGYGQAWYYGYGQGSYWGYGYGESQYCSWSMPSCGPE